MYCHNALKFKSRADVRSGLTVVIVAMPAREVNEEEEEEVDAEEKDEE